MLYLMAVAIPINALAVVPLAQLQNELHRALQKAQSSLQNGRFEITNVEAVRDAQGAVIAYQVTLHKK